MVYELEAHPSLAEWEDFKRGYFYIQDPGTLLAVRQLDPQPGENILDMCAAPGGKTTFIAQQMGNRGHITAYDNQPQRLRRLRENCVRLGVTCAEISEPGPSPKPGQTPAQLFDRALVDAPCSNTGVLRRRVDLRWRVRLEEIERLRQHQAALLGYSSRRGSNPAASWSTAPAAWNQRKTKTSCVIFWATIRDSPFNPRRQLLPFVEGVDGAYVAVLRKGA